MACVLLPCLRPLQSRSQVVETGLSTPTNIHTRSAPINASDDEVHDTRDDDVLASMVDDSPSAEEDTSDSDYSGSVLNISPERWIKRNDLLD